MAKKVFTKTAFARSINVHRSTLYYQAKQPDKDWAMKQRIESVLREQPAYGYRRLAQTLHVNEKRVRRVMKLFGIKPYRRRGRKWRKQKKSDVSFPNILMTTYPAYPNHLWATDFTYLPFQGRFVYVATVIDLFTRRIVGVSVLTTHSVQLVMNALATAVFANQRPAILHSDHGSEYKSRDFTHLCEELGITQSMSAKGCPWENGYQESFYSQFKVELGDPGRFSTLGELVYAVYQTIYSYNTTRIHSILKMPPQSFAEAYERSNQFVESLS